MVFYKRSKVSNLPLHMWGLFYYLPILEHPAIQVKNFYSPYFESTPARQQSKTKFSTPSRTPENAEYALVQHS